MKVKVEKPKKNVKRSFCQRIEAVIAGFVFFFVLAIARIALALTEKPTLREKPIEPFFVRKRA
ncbi:hypothetical protein L6252_03495 [Candidatus Parcubacteria bacterium]|nr:hypothetical protein [Candidatus Parcubacteria bacterium]